MNVDVSTYDTDYQYSAFRFGQSFTVSDIDVIVARNSYAYYLVRGVVEEALGLGVEITDEKGNVLDVSDEIWNVLEKQWSSVIRAAEIERKYGFSVVVTTIMSEKGIINGDPYLTVFSPDDVDSGSVDFRADRQLRQIKLNYVDYNYSYQTLYFSDEDGSIDNVYWNLVRPKKYFWKGMSYLEPVWDALRSLEFIELGATLFAIRIGGGLKLLVLPQEANSDDVAALKSSLKEFDSINGFVLAPKLDSFAIEGASGTLDYGALRDVMIKRLSFYTQIPKARFEGIEPGQNQGAEVNERQESRAHEKIQREYSPLIKWIIERFAIYYEWKLPESWNVQWRVKKITSEREEANVKLIRAQEVAILVSNGVIDRETAANELGYEAATNDNVIKIDLKGEELNE